jgi:hypothetical protein
VAFDGKLGQGHGLARAGRAALDGDGGAVAEEAGAVLGDGFAGARPLTISIGRPA